MADQQMQIGEVAERTGLSLRTIRHYEEVGLLVPSARSKGGFRLYTEVDIERLMTIRHMKPLNFSLEEARELLDILDALQETGATGEDRQRLRGRLESYRQVADARCEALRARLEMAEHFAASLRREPSARD
ncbi:MerR family transcriptional regulator [Streptomyces sp. CB00316]|uniref:MerR family transcriptional regulator n=1 Tax=unclassified Streptomyces TaxID=2593676 RepID=UPI00093D3D6E|nr:MULTISPECIES: MerR family transcriptional regulator [unclassified Streptomyces]MBT2381802.1 MerR family transcriptional regulator [Streptomyces sp. ISL-111]MBT2430171.1 MerR family transcriptional regulator [Streptomyces sp. ISL-112]MBT2465818.1 MerR family transcriptional regulator [Streptomyces sp. ISL-63]OKJ17812.1 MerR family transcriptional regulator [Streptomyces sp. CB00316]